MTFGRFFEEFAVGEVIKHWPGRTISETDIRELGELVSGSATGRTSDDSVTLFKSVGHAVQDVSVAAAIVSSAKTLGIGRYVDL